MILTRKSFYCTQCLTNNLLNNVDFNAVCKECGRQHDPSLSKALFYDFDAYIPRNVGIFLAEIISENRKEEDFKKIFDQSTMKDETCFFRYIWLCYILLDEVSDVWSSLADNNEPFVFLDQLKLFLSKKTGSKFLDLYQKPIQAMRQGYPVMDCDNAALSSFAEAICNAVKFIQTRSTEYLLELHSDICNVADERMHGKDCSALYYWSLTIGAKNAYLMQRPTADEHHSWLR